MMSLTSDNMLEAIFQKLNIISWNFDSRNLWSMRYCSDDNLWQKKKNKNKKIQQYQTTISEKQHESRSKPSKSYVGGTMIRPMQDNIYFV